jgi:hypothetical protein
MARTGIAADGLAFCCREENVELIAPGVAEEIEGR